MAQTNPVRCAPPVYGTLAKSRMVLIPREFANRACSVKTARPGEGPRAVGRAPSFQKKKNDANASGLASSFGTQRRSTPDTRSFLGYECRESSDLRLAWTQLEIDLPAETLKTARFGLLQSTATRSAQRANRARRTSTAQTDLFPAKNEMGPALTV